MDKKWKITFNKDAFNICLSSDSKTTSKVALAKL